MQPFPADITPADLADALHLAIKAGTFGSAIEAHLRGILKAWDEQQKAKIDHLADDPDYAALVNEQLEIERDIREAHQLRAWYQIHGARIGEAGLAAPGMRGGDGETENGTRQSSSPLLTSVAEDFSR